MFNLLPGQGLGFSATKEISAGLGDQGLEILANAHKIVMRLAMKLPRAIVQIYRGK